jgi:hypothetical protein
MTNEQRLQYAPRARAAYARYERATRQLYYLDVAIGLFALGFAVSCAALPFALYYLLDAWGP